MRVIAHLRRSKRLKGDFQAPPAFTGLEELEAYHVRRNDRSGEVALKLKRGAGIWDRNGKLLHFNPRGADLAWLPETSDLLSLEVTFGRCTGRQGIKHSLQRLNSRFEVVAQMEICVPHGGVEYLVMSPKGDLCLATWLDQNEWGYVTIDVKDWVQREAHLNWPSPTLSPPAFSLDGTQVVACHSHRDTWWHEEHGDDAEEIPSPGGSWLVGVVTAHDLAASTVNRHDVRVTVPKGWLPNDPYDSVWHYLWGPEFLSDRKFRVWLPGGREKIFDLPLPARVDIEDGLARKPVK